MPAQVDHSYRKIKPLKAFHRYLAFLLFEGRPITSRARWLNSFTLNMYALLKQLPLFKRVDDPVFIIGMGRSGTTYLAKVLSLHPVFAFLNEPKALWYKVTPHDDIIGSYQRQQGKYVLTATDASENQAVYARKFYGAFLRLTGSKRILDKYPEMIFRVDFILSLFPQARFIYLQRDGLEACQSIARWNSRNAKGSDSWWGHDDKKWRLLKKQLLDHDPELAGLAQGDLNDQERAALEWLITHRRGQELCKKHPGQILKIKYEDLLTSGESTIESVLAFCGLKSTKPIGQYLEQTLVAPEGADKSNLMLNDQLLALVKKQSNDLDPD